MPLLGLHHLAIICSDYQRSDRFRTCSFSQPTSASPKEVDFSLPQHRLRQ